MSPLKWMTGLQGSTVTAMWISRIFELPVARATSLSENIYYWNWISWNWTMFVQVQMGDLSGYLACYHTYKLLTFSSILARLLSLLWLTESTLSRVRNTLRHWDPHHSASKREGEKGAGAVLFHSCVARVGCLIWSEKKHVARPLSPSIARKRKMCPKIEAKWRDLSMRHEFWLKKETLWRDLPANIFEWGATQAFIEKEYRVAQPTFDSWISIKRKNV